MTVASVAAAQSVQQVRQLTFQEYVGDGAQGLSRERAARDEGMARASAAVGPVWREHAFLALRDLAREKPTVFVDDLYARVEWQPRSPNAWGSVWQRAIREGLIRKTGRTAPSKLRGKHAHHYPVYESLVYVKWVGWTERLGGA